jgi:hypothetical protein
MTIIVTTPESMKAEAPIVENKAEQSAPVAEATEQKEESTESETEETEVKETDSEESDTEETEESKEEEKPKKKSGLQRRFGKLTGRINTLEQEVNLWKQRALNGANESKKDAESTPAPKANDGKPSPDSFDSHADYIEALTDWKTEQKLKEREEKLERTRLESEQEKVLKTHISRVEAFKAKHDDFDELISELDDVQVSPSIQELIVSSENGPELMYELAKNREEFERLCKLPPLAAAREFGRFESKILKASEEKKQEPKKLTKAPAPIKPVGSKGGAVSKSIFDADLSQAEYEALRAKQKR